MFAAETFGVTPDVLCVANGLSGGVAPIAAMICRRHIADAFWGPAGENPGFVEGHTFEGNRSPAPPGSPFLRKFSRTTSAANARRMGERLRRPFRGDGREIRAIGDIRGKGLFQAVEFVRDPATKERFPEGTDSGCGSVGGPGERTALPVRPPLDRVRAAAGQHGGGD